MTHYKGRNARDSRAGKGGRGGYEGQRPARGKLPPTIVDTERAERLLLIFEKLVLLNEQVPVIVEGKRDVQALRSLGLCGELIAFNRGQGVYEFCEDIAEKYTEVVILTDWDREGEALFMKISGELVGMWEEYCMYRKTLRLICQKEVKDVEGIPALLRRLRADESIRE
jgi:5S rRNA maturation endonuclease (ribonuclease M5)